MGNVERDITMSINMFSDKNIRTDPEACYEELASHEEIFLEETEEELRAILIFDDPSPSGNNSGRVAECGERELDGEVSRSMSDGKDNPRIAESLDEELVDAAEELITGDADDRPLSGEAVEETLRIASNARRLKPDQ
jgi:hypothetical protein